jgi:hypothetical protein
MEGRRPSGARLNADRPVHAQTSGSATNAPRVLLVESLDAAGSDRADARDRCAALRALRAVVRVAVIHADGGQSVVGAGQAIATPGAFAEWDASPAGLAQLREFAREGRFDVVLVAASSIGGGPAARVLPEGLPVHWWPTGLAAAPGWSARLGFGRGRRHPALASPASSGDDATPAGLACSSVGALPAGRGRLTLWDGEYLLAPLALSGTSGSRLLAAFAALDGEWCGLDLVVLAEPQPAFEREARARGIGPRVHFVGRAPREAEWAWWMHARAAVIGGGGAVAGGLLLRGLESGCPMMVVRSDPTGTAIVGWLERRASLVGPQAGEVTAETLARLLGRDATVDHVRTQGRALAAEHDWNRLAKRLVAALPVLAGSAPVRARPSAAA